MDIDICPPWWPWPFPHRLRLRDEELTVTPPADARLTVGMFRALTIYNIAFQLDDKQAGREIQRLAAHQLGGMAQQLQQFEG